MLIEIISMGNSLVSDTKYYIYRRQLSNDAWVQDPVVILGEIDEGEALSYLKHEIYCFGLGNTKYSDTKAIYLYCGSQRIAKAIVQKSNNQLEIWSSAIRQYLQSDEKSQNQGCPIKYERLFFNKHVSSYVWLDSQTIAYAKAK